MRTIQKAAVVFGAAYIAVGVIGFAVTGFWTSTEQLLDSEGAALFGVFDLNPFHNIVHIGIGALWLLGAKLRRPGETEGVFLGIGLVYTLAAVLGYTGALSILAITAPLAADNFLHLVTGLAAIAVSFVLGDWSGRSRTPVKPEQRERTPVG